MALIDVTLHRQATIDESDPPISVDYYNDGGAALHFVISYELYKLMGKPAYLGVELSHT